MDTGFVSSFIQNIIDWLVLHPGWAAFVVFIICLGESLVVVGLFIPGTAVMMTIGALVALGGMGMTNTILAAIAGAIVGDGISYSIGRHYRHRLHEFWPFNKHPEWLDRAIVFFQRHGGKSVIFGRFAGPVRPIVPAVAGMLDMPPWFFYQANVVSACLWAPAYIIPGVVVGASISLAAGVTTRLVLLVVVVGGLLWATAWLVKRVYIFWQPRGQHLERHFIRFVNAHPWLWGLKRQISHSGHPHLLAMLELLTLLLLAGFSFFSLLVWQAYASAPLSLDNRVYFGLLSLRNAWADQAMILLTELGSLPVALSVLATGIAWLAWRSHWHGLGYWLIGMLLGLGAAAALHHYMPVYPPSYALDTAQPLFNSVQITVNTFIYGFLAVIIAGRLSLHWRRLPYTVTALWLLGMVFANLYLGRQWLSDTAISVALGLIWVALLGFAYRRHALRARFRPYNLALVVVLTLVLAGSWSVWRNHQDNLRHYAQPRAQYLLQDSNWWGHAWEDLPPRRIDWGGYAEQPLTLQWAGDPESLREHLLAQGWRAPKPLDVVAMVYWLVPAPALHELPLLPSAHDGQHDVMRLIYPIDNGEAASSSQYVLRLWDADTALADGTPLWVGNVTRQHLSHSLGLLSLPRTETEYQQPLRHLTGFLGGLDWRQVERPQNESVWLGWNGEVLLLRPRPAAINGE